MSYHDLLAAAQAAPVGADYHALRMAYTRTAAYAPYLHDSETVGKLRVALRDGPLSAALEAIGHLLAQNYLDIEAHMAADYVHTMQEDYDQSTYHRTFARGLIEAILGTGDGRGFDSAFIVLSVAEEYTIMRVVGFAPGQQRLVEHAGHWFDVLGGQRPDTGAMVELYFNIDLPRGWLRDQMADRTDE